jgi:hypothetical protein
MKTRILFIILTVCSNLFIQAQNKAFDKVFDAYSGTKGITTLTLSGNLLNFLFDNEESKGDCTVTSVKALFVEDSTLNREFNFYDEVVPTLNTKDYEELMTTKNKDQKLIILCKKQNQKITEFILVSGGRENSLLYIKGSLSLSNLHKVTKAVSNSDK